MPGPLPEPIDFRGVKIGVVKGYLQETFLKGAYPNAIVVALVDDVELIKALAAGKIDLFLSEEPTIESLLAQTGMLGRVRRGLRARATVIIAIHANKNRP